jgi:hypothetical protein
LRATPISDEVREGMAAEFSADNEAFVAHLLREVEAIFNPEVSSRQRSFQVKMLENLLAGFVYKSYGAVVNERGEVFGNSFWGIWQQVRLRLRAKKYGTHIYAYADFLRIAALQTDPVALARKKYEAMEALLEIFRHLRRVRPVLDEWHLDIHPFVSEESRLKIKATHAMLEKSYLELRAHRPWKRKRAAYSWKPWGRHAMCRELAEVGQ